METVYVNLPSEGIHIDQNGIPYLVRHGLEAPHDYTLITILIWLVIAFFSIGYILNIVKLYHSPADDGKAVVRTTGIFIPFIGAIIGWF